MLNGKKILVIDNNRNDIQIIKVLIDSCNIISINTNDANIIKLINKEHPDCILLSYSLNNNEGIGFLNKLNRENSTKRVPIIILTEYDSIDMVLEITKNGACDYLIRGSFSQNSLMKSIFLAIERQKLLNTVYQQQKELENIAIMDELTGINNRRALFLNIEKHISLAIRYKFPLSLCICDIDNFKYINDNYGHILGDTVIKEIANIISLRIRKTDIVGRHGGDEFIILFPNTPLEQAAKVTETIRKKVIYVCQFADKFNKIRKIDTSKEKKYFTPLDVTLSFGLTEYNPSMKSVDDLIAEADKALYYAKGHSKNVVACNKNSNLELYIENMDS